jgi:hypothetical protein
MRKHLTGLLLATALPCAFAAAAPNLPPSAELEYGVKARQSGITMQGEARLNWRHDANGYAVRIDTRAVLLGRVLEESSEGGIDAQGLAPVRYAEKRFRKDATAVSFDRSAGVISFQESDNRYPIKGGEQDRASVIWQLIGMARANPSAFRDGASYQFFVIGQRDGDPWTFRVEGQEKLRGPNGDTMAWHVTRNAPPDSKEQQVDIWLAPGLNWYPVKLRFSERSDGDYIEQTLREVRAK